MWKLASRVKIYNALRGSTSEKLRETKGSESPGSLHQLDEVVVVVNRGTDSRVVLVPLVPLNFSVTVFVSEVGQELEEDLVLGHLAVLHLGVEAAVVDSLEVACFNLAGTIGVEFQERLVNDGLSAVVQLALDSN